MPTATSVRNARTIRITVVDTNRHSRSVSCVMRLTSAPVCRVLKKLSDSL